MKRTLISLSLITVFVVAVAAADIWFMTDFASEMNRRIDLLEQARGYQEQRACALALDEYFESKKLLANRFVLTDRMEEMETLLHKMNSYIETEDEHEVVATAAELRARVNLLYSTAFYHWYHPIEFRIE